MLNTSSEKYRRTHPLGAILKELALKEMCTPISGYLVGTKEPLLWNSLHKEYNVHSQTTSSNIN